MKKTVERIPVQKTYKLYIGGAFPRTESGRYFPLKDVDDQVVANLEGTLSRGYQKRKTALMIPIVGTIFLQSSIKTGRSDAERRFSQTGRPQYVEETHDWQGSLRIFKTKSSNDGKVYIVFHEKGRSSRYRQVEFKLLSSKP